MATLKFDGLHEYEEKISQFVRDLDGLLGKATYAGAQIVADEVRRGIEALPEKTGVTKRGLLEGFGISGLQDDNGFRHVKLGFDGYNERGMANQYIARILESGTTRTKKHPFVRPAVNRTRTQCVETMQHTLDDEIETLMR